MIFPGSVTRRWLIGIGIVLGGLVAGMGPWISLAQAQSEDDLKILEMFYEDKDLVVTPSRDPKPISQVAENITVITAKEIQAINAHTLADVLRFVPGIQVDVRGGFASVDNVSIQGSSPRHALVLIDGVAQNYLGSSVADLGGIPVQQIERIEIIKGPASSTWGSSLGGVINIITKSPDENRRFGGTASASIGERTTGDFRADLSGTVGGLGYYLYAGGLTSDGLRSGMAVDRGDFYTKLSFEPTDELRLLFTLGYGEGSRDEGVAPAYDASLHDDTRNLFYTFSLSDAVSDKVDLDVSLRGVERRFDQSQLSLSSGVEQTDSFKDSSLGGSAKMTVREGIHQLVAGVDYDNGVLRAESISGGRQRLEKWAVFANDTIVYGNFSLTPGLRYDWTSTNGDFISPSLGATYTLFDKTILRAYVARGFSIPPLSATYAGGAFLLPNPGLTVEKVWSYAAGFETTALPYLWLKTMLFRYDVSNGLSTEIFSNGNVQYVNRNRLRFQGVEVEAKTVPLLNTSFLGGFAFTDARDRDTDEIRLGVARYTFDLGLDYDDRTTLKGALRGHYIWWNAAQSSGGNYSTLIWDLTGSKKIYTGANISAELFLSVHNLFNGSQYLDGNFQNARRWFEGGLRMVF